MESLWSNPLWDFIIFAYLIGMMVFCRFPIRSRPLLAATVLIMDSVKPTGISYKAYNIGGPTSVI